ncbi:AraC family transcriptional regulator [Sphingomonas sp. RS2018]
MMRAVDCPSRLLIPRHEHRRAELVYVASGTLAVTANDMLHTVSAGHALLIPAGLTHDMRMLSDASLLTAYIAPTPALAGETDCRTLPASSLLRELMQTAVGLPIDYDPDSRDGHVMGLIAEEVTWLLSRRLDTTPRLPAPKDPRLQRLCRQLLTQLDYAWTIDEAATAAGMSRRTFTRNFRRELGMSFLTWCAHARLNAAASRLHAGASIIEVAFASGYNSPSAFATTFRRHLGMSPSSFQATASAT